MNYVRFQRPEIPAPAASDKYANAETWQVFVDALDALFELSARAAKADAQAGNYLLSTAREAATELAVSVREQPKLFCELAERCPQWPVMASRHPENHAANLAMFSAIGLGEKSDIGAYDGARWNRKNPATVWAMDVIDVIKANQSRYSLLQSLVEAGECPALPEWVHQAATLKPLAKNTAMEWWKVGRQALLESYPRPEEIEELRTLADDQHKPTAQQKRTQILYLIGRAIHGIAAK